MPNVFREFLMNKRILINITDQTLTAFENHTLWQTFVVSTAKNGVGQLENSGCTPLGRHTVAQKIGDELPINAVLVGRAFTGEIYDEQLASQFPNRDWILSRILWLKGLEDGLNLGNNEQGVCCDSYARYIYIHGTPDTEPMGVPLSHGCIRMRNAEMIALFDWATVGMLVEIVQ